MRKLQRMCRISSRPKVDACDHENTCEEVSIVSIVFDGIKPIAITV